MRTIAASLFAVGLAAACGDKQQETLTTTPKAVETPQTAPAPAAAAEQRIGAGSVLLVTQSEFKPDEEGQYTVPDKAVLLVLQPAPGAWKVARIEDAASNVFHKALPYGKEGILTLGGNEALLKLWRREGDVWKGEELWHPVFGGKHNRLRDFETADFDGDGRQDLAIATHDQGVVAVVWRRADKWEPQELDRKPDTFVHEIEIGDLDKNGKLEIYATPSEPNTVSGEGQGGKIARYAWDGKGFKRDDVVSLETRHVKEILVTDLDGDGTQELYAAVEAETEGAAIKAPVEIRRFSLENGKMVESLVTTIDDRYCRFLTAGDIDQDGAKELVAAAFSTGVWVIEREGGAFRKTCIDAKSGGFEHAAYVADIDGDGKLELYVADDRGGVIRRYDYQGGAYAGQVIQRRIVPGQAMVWNVTHATLD